MLQPSAGDARLTLGRLLRGVVESAKAFPRWMDGTCVCCEAPAAGACLPWCCGALSPRRLYHPVQ